MLAGEGVVVDKGGGDIAAAGDKVFATVCRVCQGDSEGELAVYRI
jgi:hypothetical protein